MCMCMCMCMCMSINRVHLSRCHHTYSRAVARLYALRVFTCVVHASQERKMDEQNYTTVERAGASRPSLCL